MQGAHPTPLHHARMFLRVDSRVIFCDYVSEEQMKYLSEKYTKQLDNMMFQWKTHALER